MNWFTDTGAKPPSVRFAVVYRRKSVRAQQVFREQAAAEELARQLRSQGQACELHCLVVQAPMRGDEPFGASFIMAQEDSMAGPKTEEQQDEVVAEDRPAGTAEARDEKPTSTPPPDE